MFIFVKEAANFEEQTQKRRKIVPGRKVDLYDMEGMEIIPNLFEDIGWGSLLTVNKLYYPEITYESYENLHMGRIQRHENMNHQWHMISNIVIPNVGHKSYITNNHSFVMLALHEHRRMNFGYMAIEHIGGQDDDEESDKDDEYNEGQEAINVEEEESEEEQEEEIYRREMNRKISDIQERVMEMEAKDKGEDERGMKKDKQEGSYKLLYIEEQMMHKRSLKGNLQRRKRSLKTTRVYEDELIKLKTLKTRRIVRGKLVVQFSVISLKSVIRFSTTEKIRRSIV
ncbi:hypothetical protein M9H77_16427 [Catharanthus roseus]|uniref:Uncharacterized protein n=1 Tax=Catharanthus roseus TaxID=4058 RepID=A0ACC0B1R4_CATRO|nr:hypothetical protein M9H77_16427 [Catharanthus roseus]